MWQILKAELSYWRDALILIYFIATAFLIVAVVANWDIYNYMWNTTTIYFIFMGIVGATQIHEKRYRYHSTLPIKPLDLVGVDALYVLLVQLGMLVLWILYMLLKGVSVTSELFWVMLANNATILSITTLFGIHYHLNFFETKKFKRINWSIFVGLILTMIGLGYFGKLDEVSRFVWRYYASGVGALISS